MDVLGIDIGGSGIKAAPVDVSTGTLTAERVKVPTPRPAQPDPVAEAVKQLVADFGWSGPIGVTFPGVVIGGTTWTAPANAGLTAPNCQGNAPDKIGPRVWKRNALARICRTSSLSFHDCIGELVVVLNVPVVSKQFRQFQDRLRRRHARHDHERAEEP